MSRSYKKFPCGGTTTSDSEKQDKRIANRMMRSRVNRLLHTDWEDEDLILPVMNEVMNVWSMAKDGKCWWGWYDENKSHYKSYAEWKKEILGK